MFHYAKKSFSKLNIRESLVKLGVHPKTILHNVHN